MSNYTAGANILIEIILYDRIKAVSILPNLSQLGSNNTAHHYTQQRPLTSPLTSPLTKQPSRQQAVKYTSDNSKMIEIQ